MEKNRNHSEAIKSREAAKIFALSVSLALSGCTPSPRSTEAEKHNAVIEKERVQKIERYVENIEKIYTSASRESLGRYNLKPQDWSILKPEITEELEESGGPNLHMSFAILDGSGSYTVLPPSTPLKPGRFERTSKALSDVLSVFTKASSLPFTHAESSASSIVDFEFYKRKETETGHALSVSVDVLDTIIGQVHNIKKNRIRIFDDYSPQEQAALQKGKIHPIVQEEFFPFAAKVLALHEIIHGLGKASHITNQKSIMYGGEYGGGSKGHELRVKLKYLSSPSQASSKTSWGLVATDPARKKYLMDFPDLPPLRDDIALKYVNLERYLYHEVIKKSPMSVKSSYTQNPEFSK